LSQALMTMSNR